MDLYCCVTHLLTITAGKLAGLSPCLMVTSAMKWKMYIMPKNRMLSGSMKFGPGQDMACWKQSSGYMCIVGHQLLHLAGLQHETQSWLYSLFWVMLTHPLCKCVVFFSTRKSWIFPFPFGFFSKRIIQLRNFENKCFRIYIYRLLGHLSDVAAQYTKC